MLPCAAVLGFTALIDHVTAPVPLVTVAPNCLVPPPTRLALVGLTVTVSVPPPPPLPLPPKNTPFTTAFGPPTVVTLIFTLPVIFQDRYTPFPKLEIVSLSNGVPEVASTIWMVSVRPFPSQSSA